MTHLLGVMNCIMCGACVSECTAMEVDPTFTGPAALAKAYRFVADPRDEEANSRLGKLNENTGVWDCTRCLACVEVCPKDVAPMERIVKMRDLAIEEGYTNTSGYRHTESFNDSIKKHGRLDETRLALESTGLLNISGLIDLAKIELKDLISKHDKNENKIKLFLLPKDEADTKNAIIEIRAGTGGLEASLFASDLFKMYEKVSHKKKWIMEVITISRSDAGGLKEVIASIKGKNIYSSLKYESGVHRVQRVPDTETQGRVHTSAATVAVLPEAEDVDVKIEDKDLRIDVFRSSGPGGQSVNTTDSAVRITHLPTGIVVSQQDEKSQIRNKEKGLKILRSRIYEKERQKRDDERSLDRKSKIGTGDRSERIRTYNFPQGRVTDHRINLTLHKLEEFMQGEIFDEMIENLSIQAQQEKLSNLN